MAPVSSTLVILSMFVLSSNALTDDEILVFRNFVSTFSIGDGLLIESTGVPNHDYGPFPARGNPHSVESKLLNFSVPAIPKKAATPGCVGMGPIALAYNGIPIFNPFNSNMQNAVEGATAENFDDCNGHPNSKGVYHYHQLPVCLLSSDDIEHQDQFLGVALDGFPIYSPYDEQGDIITPDQLDECNGQMRNGAYEYRVTFEWPYVMGCFRGEKPNQQQASSRCVFLEDYKDIVETTSENQDEEERPGQGGQGQTRPGQGHGGSTRPGQGSRGPGQGSGGRGSNGKPTGQSSRSNLEQNFVNHLEKKLAKLFKLVHS